MPPTDRAYQSNGRAAIEATLARAGLSRVGGGTRNTYYAHVSHADRAGYAVRVGPKAYRVVWRSAGGEQTIGPERYHGQTDHAALEAWARACTTREQHVCPPVLPEPVARPARPTPVLRVVPPAAPAPAAPAAPAPAKRKAGGTAAERFREGAPDFSELRVPSSDLDTIRMALDAAALVLPEGTEKGLVTAAIEAAGELAGELDKLDAAIDDAETWIEDAGERYAEATDDARAVEGIAEALQLALPFGAWPAALAAGARGDSVGVLHVLAGKL
jgi:hypothetical protein